MVTKLETLKRSRSPITVVTAKGEVQTNEVQVYVHDLHTFVTVQLLEDTPAVFSLGELCKEHDYTCEWPSDHEPRLTKNGNQTLNRTENFVPSVGPKLSSSSTTAHPRHRLRRICLFLWIQQIREVTKELRETVAKVLRETAAKVFLCGYRTSQKTSRSQKHLQPQKFLMTQIWNVLQKWHPGSTVSTLTSQKIEIGKYACEPR